MRFKDEHKNSRLQLLDVTSFYFAESWFGTVHGSLPICCDCICSYIDFASKIKGGGVDPMVPQAHAGPSSRERTVPSPSGSLRARRPVPPGSAGKGGGSRCSTAAGRQVEPRHSSRPGPALHPASPAAEEVAPRLPPPSCPSCHAGCRRRVSQAESRSGGTCCCSSGRGRGPSPAVGRPEPASQAGGRCGGRCGATPGCRGCGPPAEAAPVAPGCPAPPPRPARALGQQQARRGGEGCSRAGGPAAGLGVNTAGQQPQSSCEQALHPTPFSHPLWAPSLPGEPGRGGVSLCARCPPPCR